MKYTSLLHGALLIFALLLLACGMWLPDLNQRLTALACCFAIMGGNSAYAAITRKKWWEWVWAAVFLGPALFLYLVMLGKVKLGHELVSYIASWVDLWFVALCLQFFCEVRPRWNGLGRKTKPPQ